MTDKQSIVLCMIVKDEEAVIERALNSVVNIIDYYVICDTGSSDNTIQVIREYFDEQGIEGEIHQRPWVSFAHNRQECFDLAKDKCDYLLTLDADEVLGVLDNGKPNLYKKVKKLPKLIADRVDVITHYGAITYNRAQFFKNTIEWSWVSPVHEVCVAKTPISQAVLEGVCVIPNSDGARAKDPKRFLRDAIVFEKEVLDDPDHARAWFYLAQSYRDGGKPEKAIEPLKMCVEKSHWIEEKAVAYLRLARYTLEAGGTFEEALPWYWLSYNTLPTKGEALYDMLCHYRSKDLFNLGVLVGELLMKCDPEGQVLFVEKPVYSYMAKDELSLCYHYTGQPKKALDLIEPLLEDDDIPEETLERLKQNVYYFKKAIEEQP